MTATPRPLQVVLNPGAGSLRIDDLETFLESLPADEQPMVDLGGGMIVPLRELTEDPAKE